MLDLNTFYAVTLLIIVASALLAFVMHKRGNSSPGITKQCENNPELRCPYTLHITPKGSVSCSGVTDCCKFQAKVKSFKAALANMEPGVNYNGISISKQLSQSIRNQNSKEND